MNLLDGCRCIKSTSCHGVNFVFYSHPVNSYFTTWQPYECEYIITNQPTTTILLNVFYFISNFTINFHILLKWLNFRKIEAIAYNTRGIQWALLFSIKPHRNVELHVVQHNSAQYSTLHSLLVFFHKFFDKVIYFARTMYWKCSWSFW